MLLIRLMLGTLNEARKAKKAWSAREEKKEGDSKVR